MKISLFTFLFIVGLFQSTNAQTSHLRFGTRIGGSISLLTGNFFTSKAKPTPGIGIYGGGLLIISLNNEWSLQQEVQYVVEIGKSVDELRVTAENGKQATMQVSTRHQVAALRVPLLLRWSSGTSKAGNVGVVAGPVGSYIVSVKTYYSMDSVFNTPASTSERDLTYLSERFQLGITAGVEYYITGNLSVDIRGVYSITNHVQTSYNASLSTLSLGAGYMF